MPKEFAQEIKVVMEERRLRTDDQPQCPASPNRLGAVAFQAHPYRVPVIGWMNDLESMTVQDARNWYNRWYVPNNAFRRRSSVMSITDAVFKLAETVLWSALKPRALPARKPAGRATGRPACAA